MAAVLLIEDVQVVRATLRQFLERAGHTVVECAGGAEALPLLQRHEIDAVVTDLWMKDGDGLEFITRLRSQGNMTPIIAVTGGDPRSPQATSAEAARQAGANHVLMKPVTKAVLLDTVARSLANLEHAREGDGPC